MIYATDVKYYEDHAVAVCISFREWHQELPDNEYYDTILEVHEYVPGEFYKRELPCILQVLKQVPLQHEDLIIVDAYVFLDEQKTPGLGYHLFKALNKNYAVLGVAKSRFKNGPAAEVKEVYRGSSKVPLFISSIGIDTEDAAKHVEEMAGTHRLPFLLRYLDTKTKS